MESTTTVSENLKKEFTNKLAKIAAQADNLPGILIIHNLQTHAVEYMSERGLQLLNTTLEELTALGSEYFTKYFNPEDAKDYVPKILAMLERNNDQEIVSFFQQVRFADTQQWVWHFSATKVFMRNEAGKPLYASTIALPVESANHVTAKVARLLEENEFLRTHFHKFDTLSKREQEILKLSAQGKSSPEIAEALFISAATVETHRRNLKRKLNVHSSYELLQYAYAFDLI